MHLAAWLIACQLTAATGSNAHLAQAEKLVGNLQYSEAARALTKARNDPGNARQDLLRILELTAVVEASLNHRSEASSSFRELLSIAPDYKLGDEWGPKVRTPYYEAKGWVGDHGSLTFTANPPKVEPGRVDQLQTTVATDALSLAQSVRFHVVGAADGPPVSLVSGQAAFAPTQAQATVSWWAELLGSRGEVLEVLGTAAAPLKAEAPPAAPATSAPTLAAAPETSAHSAPAEVTASAPPPPSAPLRPLAYGLVGGGVVAEGVGVLLGVMQKQDQNQLTNATRDAQGHVTGMTQKAAFNLQSSANTDGLVADVLFAAGAVAIASGVGVWVWGSVASSPTASASLALGPGQVVLAGSFP